MSKWTYEKVSEAFDALESANNEEGWLEFRRKALMLLERAGWTEEEFETETLRRLGSFTAAVAILDELEGGEED